ncbi:MAG: hypothetical protein DRJ50_10725 [Actinobacteria bacterium]|nr:MAG: hypothetical protein DRJ50_10725 [Actinomycetota bacterium]
MTDQKARLSCEVVKTDASRRLVFGHLIVCKINGEDYHDTDGSNVPEDVMLDAALSWAKSVKPADVMHEGDDVGTHPFLFPMTTEVAKAFGIDDPKKTGLMIAQQVDAATFERFESGELKGFSVEGGGGVEFI